MAIGLFPRRLPPISACAPPRIPGVRLPPISFPPGPRVSLAVCSRIALALLRCRNCLPRVVMSALAPGASRVLVALTSWRFYIIITRRGLVHAPATI
eukprot:6976047-Pyramimonas_sp.AAC.1